MEKIMQIKDEKPSEKMLLPNVQTVAIKLLPYYKVSKGAKNNKKCSKCCISVFFKFGFASLRLFIEEKSFKKCIRHL